MEPIEQSDGWNSDVQRTFFSITGLHLMQVISGVIALTVIAIGYNTDWLDAGHVETLCGFGVDVPDAYRMATRRVPIQ